MDTEDKDLAQVLREMPWSAVLTPLALGLFVAGLLIFGSTVN